MDRLRSWARSLKAQLIAVYLLARHADTPRHAKLVAALTVAYALSPIDLIPDFVPVLGLLDDLLIVPAGLWLALRLTPARLRQACALQAREWVNSGRRLPVNRAAALLIVLLWLAAAAVVWCLLR